MSVPFSQAWTVTRYVLGRRLRGVKRYPLVLMLEPLLRCNLACAGCGKIQHPAHILCRQLTPQQCFAAVEECRAPIVSIPGGEPLLHPEIGEIVRGLTQRRKFVYLCTNGIKLKECLDQFKPSKYLAFSVHLDGPRADHDRAVCRPGVYDAAVDAIRAALKLGFRVTTNTTLFNDVGPERMRQFFDQLMDVGVEGMMISPGFAYEKAPQQEGFLDREQTKQLFSQILGQSHPRWKFNQTPLYLQFLQGKFSLECTPWGTPTYNVFGWQKPCYLLDEGYCDSFVELLHSTDWSQFGHASGNVTCRNCMVHCGFEPSAMEATLGSWRGLATSIRLMLPKFKRRAPVGTAPEASQISA